MTNLSTRKLISKISKTRKHSNEYNEIVQEFNNRISEINPIKIIKIDPEFVTCSTSYGTAYAWKVDQEGLMIIENTRKECVESFQEAYWLEFGININVILEER